MKKFVFLFLFIFSCFALFAEETVYEQTYDYSNRTEYIKLIKNHDYNYTIITINLDKKKNIATRYYVYCSEEEVIKNLLFELENNRLEKDYSSQLEDITKNNSKYEFMESSIDTNNNIVFKDFFYFYVY